MNATTSSPTTGEILEEVLALAAGVAILALPVALMAPGFVALLALVLVPLVVLTALGTAILALIAGAAASLRVTRAGWSWSRRRLARTARAPRGGGPLRPSTV